MRYFHRTGQAGCSWLTAVMIGMTFHFIHDPGCCSAFAFVNVPSTSIGKKSLSRSTITPTPTTSTTETEIETTTTLFFCPPIRHPNQRPLSTAIPTPSATISTPTNKFKYNPYNDKTNSIHPCLQNQRRSTFGNAQIYLMGLFGLGTAEIVIIAVVGVVLLGPDQVSSQLGKLVGQVRGEIDDLPDELKRIPEEFQKGVEEGEMNARSRNAKQMSNEADGDDDDDDSSSSSNE